MLGTMNDKEYVAALAPLFVELDTLIAKIKTLTETRGGLYCSNDPTGLLRWARQQLDAARLAVYKEEHPTG